MAYTMIHIIIAEEIFSKFSLNINENDFLIGTIAPDAVHSCEEFSYKLKEKSHFFPESLTWGKVDTCTKANLWMDSVLEFYEKNKENINSSFLLGYIIHVFVDIYNALYYYYPYVNAFYGTGEEKVEKYKIESQNLDKYLYTKYAKIYGLQDKLYKGFGYNINGIITAEQIEKRREYLISTEWKKALFVLENEVCTLDSVKNIKEGTTQFIYNNFICKYLPDALDVADRMAEETTERYTHEEIFAKMREAVND